MNRADSNTERRGVNYFFAGGVAAIVLGLLLLIVLVWVQESNVRSEARAREAALAAGKRVRVVAAKPGNPERTVSLAGEARAYAAVTLYAKVSGYLKDIKVDKGDKVEADQVLAIIESPELDRQYLAAVADAKNKRLDAERYRALLKSGSVSEQMADNIETTAKVAEENAAALKAQLEYLVVRAPFVGTVTARFVDPGALLQAAVTAQTTAQGVLSVSQTDRLRVYVYPDQRTASLVQVGDRAEVTDPSGSGTKLPATVSRTSGELDVKTRTLLVELEVDNREGKILAGSFVKVSLTVRTPPYVEIPVEALVMRSDKTFVAIPDDENKVTFREVTLSDSDGKLVKVSAGLKDGERVILGGGGGLSEGDKVQPIKEDSGKKGKPT
ncbi:MAG: efflux RND transporter periplasmic adaptor subunit [Desulfomonile tiedjei]|nr:efflux RND transporter periplasmic adaptor subunit [Desulfomonile tiedjei]